ncbi:MAG: glucosaminidase domain-containing protein [Deltaproteobacteria bacterium]|nr:glucosaminidase domain-containing protein [Deltaproteobacteria bacterium]
MSKAYTLENKIQFIIDIYSDALRVSKQSGFSFDFILSQAAYETGWGKKIIPGTNNLFNIKADHSWNGPAKKFVAPEHIKVGDETETIPVESKFRVYGSFEESLNDWFDFLRTNPRYHGIGVNSDGVPHINIFDPEVKEDPELLAVALWHDGFATDVNYVNNVIRTMRGPTMRKALEKARSYYEHPLSSYDSIHDRVGLEPSRLSKEGKPQQERDGGSLSSETLKRDLIDYRMVWRIKEDGSTRGYFICND